MFCCVKCDSKRFMTLKPNIYCFCLEHHYQHGFVLLENLAYSRNKGIIYGPELNLQNRVFSYLFL